jgi:hypothetical protein
LQFLLIFVLPWDQWVPWQHLDGSWFALYFHWQRNIKFSFRRHILCNEINLLVLPKARPLDGIIPSSGNKLFDGKARKSPIAKT